MNIGTQKTVLWAWLIAGAFGYMHLHLAFLLFPGALVTAIFLLTPSDMLKISPTKEELMALGRTWFIRYMLRSIVTQTVLCLFPYALGFGLSYLFPP